MSYYKTYVYLFIYLLYQKNLFIY